MVAWSEYNGRQHFLQSRFPGQIDVSGEEQGGEGQIKMRGGKLRI